MTSIIGTRSTNPLLCRHPDIPLNLPFIEGSGDTAYDLSGNSNNGTITNAEWTSTDHGWALDFNGTTSYVNCGSGSSLNIIDAITIETVMSLSSLPSMVYTMVSKTNCYVWSVHPTGKLYFNYHNGTDWVGAAYSDYVFVGGDVGSLFHTTITYQNTGDAKVYIDGVLDKETSVTPGNIRILANNLFIGSWSSTTNFFAGNILYARLYNRTLSATEVKHSYLDLKRRLRI